MEVLDVESIKEILLKSLHRIENTPRIPIDKPSKWDIIRHHYSIIWEDLHNGNRPSQNRVPIIDPSPLEIIVWDQLRCNGLPFYPEYPLLNYFVDFADPIKKIGVEVDGKEYHQDKAKDEYRDWRCEQAGWKIIRIEGKLVYVEPEDLTEQFEDEYYTTDDDKDYANARIDYLSKHGHYTSSSQGIIEKIRIDYYD